MEIHHGKHHAGYTNKLNAAIEGTDLEGKSIEDILTLEHYLLVFATMVVGILITACFGM